MGKHAGENEVEQMQCVMEILGPPPAQLVQKGSRRDHFFEGEGQPRMTPNKAGLRRYPGSKELAQALACSDAHFVSFLQVQPAAAHAACSTGIPDYTLFGV